MTGLRLLARLAPVVVLLGLSVAPALAQSQASPDAAQLVMTDPARGAKGHLTLRATLTTSTGAPLTDKRVSFYERVNLFGEREALISTANTDSTGYVAVDYQPAANGEQTIIARSVGDARTATAEATSTIQVRDAVVVYTPDPLPLASVRQWLPLGLGSLVLATWGILIGVTLRTMRGIKAAHDAHQSEETQAQQEPVLAFATQSLEGRNS